MNDLPNELVLKPPTALAVDYVATWNGAKLTHTRDTHGPLRARFAIGADELVLDRERPARPDPLLKAIAKSLLQRNAYALTGADGLAVARAQQRGLRDAGWDVDDGRPGVLHWDAGERRYSWRRGERTLGHLARPADRSRGIVARFDDETRKPIAVFIALLALARWETVTRSDAVTT